jgi:IPT/TIG domain
MRAQAIIWVLILLINLVGCGSDSNPRNRPPSEPNISISPVSATAGSSDVVLTVTGSKFVSDTHNKSVVVWSANGIDTFLATTLDSNTQLTAVIPAALLVNPVNAKVLVETGDPIGSLPLSRSDSITFQVTAVQPGSVSISAISPVSTVAGSPDLTLTITGSNFATGNASSFHSAVVWSVNDTYLNATVVSDTQIIAVVPAALLINPIKAKISVEIWFFADSFPSGVSNSVDFTVKTP